MIEEVSIGVNQKRIPVDRSRRGRPRKVAYKYPFAGMEVGDSFDVPLPSLKDMTTAARVTAAAADYKNRAGLRKDEPPYYTVRTYRKEGIVRCWRVE